MNVTSIPAPSRRRGRPPKVKLEPTPVLDESLEGVHVGPFINLAPPQESAFHIQAEPQPVPSSQAPTVPSPLPSLPTVTADDVDLRETPAMAARHSQLQISGSDSKVRGASDSYLPVEAGKDLPVLNPALPEQSQALPVKERVQERIPEPSRMEAMHPPAAPVQIIPPVPPGPDWVPIQENDVVQINSSHNKLYGALFTVAGIRNHRIHGYQLLPGGKHEYITVNENECFRIGPSKVRSRNGCSAKWIADIR